MKIAPSSAATNLNRWNVPSCPASAVPTSTGATDAGSVRGRAAISQMRALVFIATSGPAREFREVGPPLLLVRLAPLLGLIAHVEEEVRVVGELLDARKPVLRCVEARLQQPQREGRELEHLGAPRHRLL